MGVRVFVSFVQANVDPITGVWTNNITGCQVLSNTVRRGTAGGGTDGFSFYNADTPPLDHYAELAWAGGTGNTAGVDNDDGGPIIACDSSFNGYLMNAEPNDVAGPKTHFRLFVLTAGSGVDLSGTGTGVDGPALSAGDIVRVERHGNVISGLLNGVVLLSGTDSTWATKAGYGIHLFDNATPPNGSWKNFVGGDFVSAPKTLPHAHKPLGMRAGGGL